MSLNAFVPKAATNVVIVGLPRAVVLNLTWFVAPFQRLPTLVAPCSSIGFCNITAELYSKGLSLWPPSTLVEKPWPRAWHQLNPALLFKLFSVTCLQSDCTALYPRSLDIVVP